MSDTKLTLETAERFNPDEPEERLLYLTIVKQGFSPEMAWSQVLAYRERCAPRPSIEAIMAAGKSEGVRVCARRLARVLDDEPNWHIVFGEVVRLRIGQLHRRGRSDVDIAESVGWPLCDIETVLDGKRRAPEPSDADLVRKMASACFDSGQGIVTGETCPDGDPLAIAEETRDSVIALYDRVVEIYGAGAEHMGMRPVSAYPEGWWGGPCIQGSAGADRWATEARDSARETRAVQARLATLIGAVDAHACELDVANRGALMQSAKTAAARAEAYQFSLTVLRALVTAAKGDA